ncbi:MAG: helix-turn-helix domain-containing protein [Candidatus Moraniibacteriota bacterium]
MPKTSSPAKHTDCPLTKVTDILGDQYSLRIVRDLLSGPKRFTELQHSLTGISTRTLTLKLQKLECARLIKRKAYSEKPPRVEYTLTSEGKGLSSVVNAMMRYGEKYLSSEKS